MLVWNLKAKIIYVETAFLLGDLKYEIFMEIPEGIYGLVPSERQIYINLVEAVKSCGFKGSELNPCFWTKDISL
jgi:hypothetical protein